MPLLILLLWLLSGVAPAREWYAPVHSGRNYVNADLSSRRAARHAREQWDGQLVLWVGRLRNVKRSGVGWRMQLETDGGTFPVRCPKPVLTLKPDPREGYRVALKGNLQVANGKVTGLLGRSIILLGPPRWKPARTREEFLTQWIQFHRPDEKPGFAPSVARSILTNSKKHGIDPLLLTALLQVESAFRKDAVSESGAIGLGQLMPFTAEGLGVNAHDPAQNVAGASKMFAGLVHHAWNSDADPRALALASYNAGPSLVRELQAVPRIPETNNYVYFIGFVHRHLAKLAPAQ